MEEDIPPKTPSWNSQALTFWTHLPAFFNGHHPCIYDPAGSVTYSQRKSSAYLKRDVSASWNQQDLWTKRLRSSCLGSPGQTDTALCMKSSFCVSPILKLTLINHGFGCLRHSITDLSSPPPQRHHLHRPPNKLFIPELTQSGIIQPSLTSCVWKGKMNDLGNFKVLVYFPYSH